MSPVWGVVLVALSFSQLVNGHCLDCKLDICFVLEQFEYEGDWNNSKTMIATLVYMMNIGPEATQFGLVQFAREAQPVFDLDDHDNKADLLNAISGLSQVGPRRIKLKLGLNAVRTDCFGAGHGERVGVPRLAIILTNGNNRKRNILEAVRSVRYDNITILFVGVDPNVDTINVFGGYRSANTFLPRPVLQEPILLPSGIYTFGSVVTDLFNRVKDFCVPGVDCNYLTRGSGRLRVNIASPGDIPDYREALCENGWMVLLRRQDGTVNFSFKRRWADYRDGFGSLEGELWTGLDLMHHVTNNGHNYSLRVDFQLYNGTNYYALYSSFSVGPASDYYRLHVSGYDPSSTLGDSLARHNGMRFTTVEQDHRTLTGPDCTTYFGGGGWWYKDDKTCDAVHLTAKYGAYPFIRHGLGIVWFNPWRFKTFAIQTSMRIRRTL